MRPMLSSARGLFPAFVVRQEKLVKIVQRDAGGQWEVLRHASLQQREPCPVPAGPQCPDIGLVAGDGCKIYAADLVGVVVYRVEIVQLFGEQQGSLVSIPGGG